ncbi:MAG: hypothetical protein ACQGVC_06045 [Myxococcota bacterium]
MSGRSRQRIALLALAAAAVAGCATDETPPGYYEAAEEVRRNLKTPAGHTYGELVQQRTRNAHERAARRCYVHVPDSRGAHLLYQLDAEGGPRETFVYPPSEFGACVSQALGNLETFDLPPPPEADYWIGLPVELRAHPPGRPDP